MKEIVVYGKVVESNGRHVIKIRFVSGKQKQEIEKILWWR